MLGGSANHSGLDCFSLLYSWPRGLALIQLPCFAETPASGLWVCGTGAEKPPASLLHYLAWIVLYLVVLTHTMALPASFGLSISQATQKDPLTGILEPYH